MHTLARLYRVDQAGWHIRQVCRLKRLPEEITKTQIELNLVAYIDLFGYGDSWTVESAGNVMRTDCETGR